MAINDLHPLYAYRLHDWELMTDSYKGEGAIKEAGTKYLPATSGMTADGHPRTGSTGSLAYEAYKTRAVYHDFVKVAVQAYIGLMWDKPPSIELPPAMEQYLEKATVNGEGLEGLLRRINEHQLVRGRVGLFADLPTAPDPNNPNQLPLISLYAAEAVQNWDAGTNPSQPTALNLVVLNETGPERKNVFTWMTVQKWRVLVLGDPIANELAGTYRFGVYRERGASFNATDLVEPSFRGRTLNEIPFVFVNSKDLIADPDEPPLLGLARLCLAIYRGEADYRQNLFMQGQDTLVTIGANLPEDGTAARIGAGARLDLPLQGDAKYIGVNSQGLAEQRQALEADKAAATLRAGTLADPTSKQKESGDALNTRMAAMTATLNTIALSGAAGLEKLLKTIAVWIGANPDDVEVKPNLEFADIPVGADELVKFMTARGLGLPLSLESIHDLLRRKGLTDMEFQDELDLIAEEDATIGARGVPADPNAQPKPGQKAPPPADPNAQQKPGTKQNGPPN